MVSPMCSGMNTATQSVNQTLETYRRVRDEVVSVMPWGHYFLNLSNEHRDELITILTANPELCGDSVALLQQWEPLAEAVLSGRTANTTISTAQIDALEATIEAFRPLVSSSLTTDGESALALYEPLDQYAGMTIQYAVHDVLTARFSIRHTVLDPTDGWCNETNTSFGPVANAHRFGVAIISGQRVGLHMIEDCLGFHVKHAGI